MCGIFAAISKEEAQGPNAELLALLTNRGPDLCGIVSAATRITNGDTVSSKFVSTVLALRGDHIASQPLTNSETGSVLCWNGEAWKIGQDVVVDNDGEAIIRLLSTKTSSGFVESMDGVLDVLRSISGPFAFVYYDKVHGLVYFGRDCLGRRSLLYNADDMPNTIQLSSIAGAAAGSWKEVEADGIYVLVLDKEFIPSSLSCLEKSSIASTAFPCYRYPWVPSDSQGVTPSLSLGVLNQDLPQEVPALSLSSHSVKQLEQWMDKSLRLRILNIPDPPHQGTPAEVKLAILFSGGLDCTVLARMAHNILPLDQPIDLLNVAFENPRVILAAKQPPNVKKQRKCRQGRRSQIESLVEEIPSIEEEKIAAEIPPIEETTPYEACPDRITGRSAVRELRKICPGRKWRFVEVNVPYTEFLSHKSKVVSLIYPHNTEMDLSIACALYFASRGLGQASLSDDIAAIEYSTPARVFLSGLGADELFGGYTRHATAFSRHGFQSLIDELDLDVSRLGKRNLGRDDRAISNWSREVRFPFLDEDLVKWSLACPVWEKCGFGTPDGNSETSEPELEPGKKVLRLLAWKLGMHSVAQEKKRAIQFGARTAKMETGRSKGTTLLS